MSWIRAKVLLVCLSVILPISGSNKAALSAPQTTEYYRQLREQMVEYAVKGAGVKDERVLKAMLATPRHEFVPRKLRKTQSYLDAGIPIGDKQTISSPFIVAYMTESLDPQPTDKVLEIGTGSGYQAGTLENTIGNRIQEWSTSTTQKFQFRSVHDVLREDPGRQFTSLSNGC